MSAGIGIIGRDVVMTMAGQTVLGVRVKGLTLNNERLDTTDDGSNGWAEALAVPGRKNIEFTISGMVKNLELVRAYFNGASSIYAVTLTYPDGSIVSGDFFYDSMSPTGEENALATFDASFSSSGAVTFTAGT
jgi:predicted secreted protein